MVMPVCVCEIRRVPSSAVEDAHSVEDGGGGCALPEGGTSEDGQHAEEGPSSD